MDGVARWQVHRAGMPAAVVEAVVATPVVPVARVETEGQRRVCGLRGAHAEAVRSWRPLHLAESWRDTAADHNRHFWSWTFRRGGAEARAGY